MIPNSNAIVTLCSHLCVGSDIAPLEPREWSELAKQLQELKFQPEDLLGMSLTELTQKALLKQELAERIVRLVDRNASLSFELSRYENMGITAITRADPTYPAKLKRALGSGCPPIFYCAGDMRLLDRACVGYVGSRTVSEADISFARATIEKTAGRGYGVVSGGAKGIDIFSETAALELGVPAVEYLSDSMMKKMKLGSVTKAVQNGQMLLLSVVNPDAGFNVGVAMMRNRYIYAQSSGTVIVRSEYNKGGTWNGATENLRNKWCAAFCWDNPIYTGNTALIKKGARPIDHTWDGDVEAGLKADNNSQQLSLFDFG